MSGRRRIPSRKVRSGEEEEEADLEREMLEEEDVEQADPQVWKKKKTSIYLSKSVYLLLHSGTWVGFSERGGGILISTSMLLI